MAVSYVWGTAIFEKSRNIKLYHYIMVVIAVDLLPIVSPKNVLATVNSN